MRFIIGSVLLGFSGLALSFPQTPNTAGDPLPEPDPAVTRAALEHHVRFLASDELRGRMTGTPESARASAYLASALERAGVQPGGEDGGWFQPVPLMKIEQLAEPTLVLHDPDGAEQALSHGHDFSVRIVGQPGSNGTFRVKVVHEVSDVPEEDDPGLALVMESSRSRSTRWLEERGHPDGQGFGLIVRVRPDSKGSAPRQRGARIQLASAEAADSPETLTVNGEPARQLWDGEIERLTLALNAERVDLPERNVVGILPGRGTPEHPELATEVIVISAHFDHIGVVSGRDPETDEEDVIRNGADDDASGTAALLELAEAFAAGEPPARTLVFLFCAAEELGMIGTSWYADHPTVELERIVCNLNLEMLGMPDEAVGGPGKIWLTGFERSSLGPRFHDEGLDVVADPRPERRYFQRSDNIVFVRKGIVAHTLSTGGDNPNYHQVGDEADTLDFDHLLACTRSSLVAAGMLADGTLKPVWNEGEPDLGGR